MTSHWLTSRTVAGQGVHEDGLFLKDEVLRSSETSVNIYQSTRRKATEGLNVHAMQRYEGLRTSGSLFFLFENGIMYLRFPKRNERNFLL